jgi:hypothetical protein
LDDVKWFSSVMLGVLATNNRDFGLALNLQKNLSSSTTAKSHIQNQTHKAFSTL